MVEHQTQAFNSSLEQTSLVRRLSSCRSQEIHKLLQESRNVNTDESMSSDSESYTSNHSPSPSHGPDPNSGQRSMPGSSSPSSIMTLDLTHVRPRGGVRRLGSGTEARGGGWESPEEGGHSEAPPAYLSFGISVQRAEQGVESSPEKRDSASERDLPSANRHRRSAEERDSASETDLPSPNRHRRSPEERDSASERDLPSPNRHRRSAEERDSASERDLCSPNRHRRAQPSHNESQSERHVKEAKSRCKRIALLLTNAPNPRNRGVLMFKKRRQRVKKYTLISYGTGQQQFDHNRDKDVISEEGKAARFTYASSDYSEQEDYSVNAKYRDNNLDWDHLGIPIISQRLEAMEQLPETEGKGVAMFAQRRQRMDDIALEQEEMRRKGSLVEGIVKPKDAEANKSNVRSNTTQSSEGLGHTNAHGKQHLRNQETHQQEIRKYDEMMNNLPNHQASAISKPLVANRTAKPFLGFQNRVPVPFYPHGGASSPLRHHEFKFKVSVPIHTAPQVWSPTGDVIASRDERISVPAIKTGILPDSKRRGANRTTMGSSQPSNSYIQNKGERKSYVESAEEEDYFSLGAEACNFMQRPTIKHKIPPPVAPKPNMNLACPPWLKDGSSNALFHPSSSTHPASSHSPAGLSHQYFQQTDLHSQMRYPEETHQSQAGPQPPTKAWTPTTSTSASHHMPTINSWSPQPTRSPVSIEALNQTRTATHQPTVSHNKSRNTSVSPCHPHRDNSYNHAAKATPNSPMGHVSEGHISHPGDGPTLKGRGAELFAQRQVRMEKFVVDAETVQANKDKSTSPAASLPDTWRYSANVRDPPSLSYNRLHAPLYHSAAAKQAPPTRPKPKTKFHAKVPQYPHQLDSSMCAHQTAPGAADHNPKTQVSPISTPRLYPPSTSSPAHIINPSPAHIINPRPAPGTSSYATHDLPTAKQQTKPIAPAKSPGSGLGRSFSLSLHRPKHPQSPMSHVTTPVFQPTWQEQAALKPPSPWEAAARSSLGLVDDAFRYQNVSQSIATNVNAAAKRRSLPEPPEEWKQKVSLDSASVRGYYGVSHPSMHTRSRSLTSAPVCGPPFRQAQPLWTGSRIQVAQETKETEQAQCPGVNPESSS
ncbi:hypothetical protein DPEC_G00192360 [Dallia pectoralis]|uniref:Uncharacterized protein n=1 Tax=Dallia pectoralis TaxID=75939 RepID=A0ACC2GCE0_DALPE|nr:hypothetical protein DPEC_G00192360 [Dallia pectoralis]